VQTKQNPIDFIYESSIGHVHALECSPFHKNLFLTCNNDGLIRLYNMLHSQEITVLKPCDFGVVYDSAFSPFRPMVIASAASNGHLYMYDLSATLAHPVADIEVSKKPLRCVSFNPAMKEFLATADDFGQVKIWQLNDYLTVMQKREANKLADLANTTVNQ